MATTFDVPMSSPTIRFRSDFLAIAAATSVGATASEERPFQPTLNPFV